MCSFEYYLAAAESLQDKKKQPWLFTLHKEDLMVFADLWESWHPNDAPKDTPVTESFTFRTTEAATYSAWIHDRFPVILEPEDWVHWMDDKIAPEELNRLVVRGQRGRAATEMNQWKVTPKMNTVKYEASDAVLPLEEGNLLSEM